MCDPFTDSLNTESPYIRTIVCDPFTNSLNTESPYNVSVILNLNLFMRHCTLFTSVTL